MGEKYSWVIREKAENLFIFKGVGFREISAETGVSPSQLKRWAIEGSWIERQKEHHRVLADMKQKKLQLHQLLIENALDTLDPKAVSAACRWIATDNTGAPPSGEPDDRIDHPALFIEDFRFIVETIKEIDPEGLKILARSYDTIIDRFKKKHLK
jgi:hypothetical protein